MQHWWEVSAQQLSAAVTRVCDPTTHFHWVSYRFQLKGISYLYLTSSKKYRNTYPCHPYPWHGGTGFGTGLWEIAAPRLFQYAGGPASLAACAPARGPPDSAPTPTAGQRDRDRSYLNQITIWDKKLYDCIWNISPGKLLPTLLSPAVMFCSAPAAASRVVELISHFCSTWL